MRVTDNIQDALKIQKGNERNSQYNATADMYCTHDNKF